MRGFEGKQFIKNVFNATQLKDDMTDYVKTRYLLRAMFASFIVGFGYMIYMYFSYAFHDVNFVIGGVEGSIDISAFGKLLACGFFPLCLVAIYYTKSELLTSNMMMVSVSKYYNKISMKKFWKILFLCLLGNILGAIVIAILIGFSSIVSPGMYEQISNAVTVKQNYILNANFMDLIVRAIFCNIFINIAILMVYSENIKDDYGKVVAMFFGVFIFAYLGLEHSVANIVLFAIIGVYENINGGDIFNMYAAVSNVLFVLVGNMIGGGLFIGVLFSYINDYRKYKNTESIEGENNVNS